jgi:hypothetical protein
MPRPPRARHALVLRPYPGVTQRDFASAHIEGVIMSSNAASLPVTYGALAPIRDDDSRRRPRHLCFRLTSQIDERCPTAYAIHYGYAPAVDRPFTPHDHAVLGPSLAALGRRMTALQEADPQLQDLELIAARLVAVLRLDALIVLRPRDAHDWFRPEHPVLAASEAENLAQALEALGYVQRVLHQGCQQRLAARVA